VQPDGIVTVALACGAVAWLYMTLSLTALAPVAEQAEGTVTVSPAIPNAVQPL